MKLKHLTLNKVVDAVYGCGIAKLPVSLIIAAPPGTGKTWSTKGITDQIDVPFIQYITGGLSPTAHRNILLRHAETVRLIIHDDIGLCDRFSQDQLFSTYMMVHGGLIQEQHYKTLDNKKITSSVIICCTLSYWADHQKTMQDKGMLDRFLPIVLDLSEETRTEYQKNVDAYANDNDPPKRKPIIEQGDIQRDMTIEYNINPRWMKAIQRMSMFLTPEELLELINVINRPMVYEV